MPTDTTKPVQKLNKQDLMERVDNSTKDLEACIRNEELVRKASPATVEHMETVIARLDGLHWQSVNALKSLVEIHSDISKAKDCLKDINEINEVKKMSLTDKLWVVGLGAWIVLLALEIGKFF